jgi:hypothetical protein
LSNGERTIVDSATKEKIMKSWRQQQQQQQQQDNVMAERKKEQCDSPLSNSERTIVERRTMRAIWAEQFGHRFRY